MKHLIGKPVKIIPCYSYKKNLYTERDESIQPVRGVIESVNENAGWFRVAYPAGRSVQHECFKEADIGGVVVLLGRR